MTVCAPTLPAEKCFSTEQAGPHRITTAQLYLEMLISTHKLLEILIRLMLAHLGMFPSGRVTLCFATVLWFATNAAEARSVTLDNEVVSAFLFPVVVPSYVLLALYSRCPTLVNRQHARTTVSVR